MSPDPSSHNRSQSATQARFKLLLLSLSLSTLLSSLLPHLARAGVLDVLSGSLQQATQQVTGSITAPIQQVGSTINGALTQAEGSITGAIGSITNPIGTLNQTLQMILAPFQQQLQQYLQIFNISFQKILQDIFSGVFNGGSGGGGQQPWDEQWSGNRPPSSGGSSSGSAGLGRDFDIPDIITGPLGIPDFIQNHQAIFNKTVGGATAGTPGAKIQRADRFNLNPVPLAQSLKFMEDRAQNNGMAATVLSSEGQAAMKQEMEAATATLQQIQAKAQQAQSFDVSQDVLKNLTALQANQSALLGGSYAQLMALRAQEAANSVVTSNISEALDEENRARHAESMAAADHVLRTAAGFYLPGMVK